MLSQDNISDVTPNGATLVDGGATFRVFAPNAVAVYLNGTFNGKVYDGDDAATLLEKRGSYWTGFMAGQRMVTGIASGSKDLVAGRLDTSATRTPENC